MAKRFKIPIEVTVHADTRAEAVQIVQRALGASDQIEHYLITLETIVAAASPWRELGKSKPPQDGKPFFARNVGTADDAEFATAIKWHTVSKEFVDSDLKEFPFTHWMPIPPV